MLGAEVFAQTGLDDFQYLGLVRCSEESHGESVYIIGQPVVGACDLQQIFQLELEFSIALPQHRDLTFDKRNGGAAALVRQPQRCQQIAVLLEKLGVYPQIVLNGFF